MLTDKELFTKAFALVSNPETWCQNASARNDDGHVVAVFSGEATRFCSFGACMYVGGETDGERFFDLLSRFTHAGLIRYNDTHTHAEVVEQWRGAGWANGWLDS